MGRYIDWGDIVARYGNAVAGDFSSPEAQEGYIVGAEDALDAACAARYTVPFTNPPGIPGAIPDLAIDLAYYKMYITSDRVKELKKYIDERIKAIQEGDTVLVVGGLPLGVGDFAVSGAQGRLSSFGPDDAENWRTDPDWIEDAQTERT